MCINYLVEELKLNPGVYKARLIYIAPILLMKKNPKYAENKDGKTREWVSNEITMKLADKGLQDFLSKHPEADSNKDDILTEEEKNNFLASKNKQEENRQPEVNGEDVTEKVSTPEKENTIKPVDKPKKPEKVTPAQPTTSQPPEKTTKETNQSTLHLKDGRIITGTITHENKNSVKVKTGVIEFTINKDEIKRIEKK